MISFTKLFSFARDYAPYRIAGKFGGELNLAVRAYNRQIKVRQYFLHAYMRMVIPYRTAKFKSANISGYTV